MVLGIRLLGFGLVTPFIEELFVRSFLIRYLEVFDQRKHFRDVPMAMFAWRSFIGTVLYFTFSHAQWEWPVAAATGIAYNGWLYYRGNIGSTILAHAVTNVSLFFFVVLGSGRTFRGELLNLWYFL
jgi:CAAX prenyl protease-like protein